METRNYGSQPEFDESIVEDYRRASAEGFTKPPSASLRQAPKEEPFRWPGIDQRRDTVALQRDELSAAVQRKDAVPERSPVLATNWVLDIVGGPLIALPGKDLVVGRKPGTIPGCVPLRVEDQARTLSKSHVRLTLEGERWVVEDLGSTNGTALIIGEDERVLAPGEPAYVTDVFRMGTLRVRIRPIITPSSADA